MSRLVHLVLKDGRSVVGGCDIPSRERIELALADPGRTLTLTSDDRVDVLPASEVRDFALVDGDSAIPHASRVYRIVRAS